MNIEQFIRAFGDTRQVNINSDGKSVTAHHGDITLRISVGIATGAFTKSEALAALITGAGNNDGMPELSVHKPDTFVAVPVATLKELLPWAANKDIRQYLVGICIQHDRAVATNGHVLRTSPMVGGPVKECIIPREMIAAAIKAKAEFIHVGDDWIYWESGDISASCRPIEGKFPDVDRVIPKKQEMNFKVTLPSAKDAKAWVKQAKILRPKFPAIIISGGYISAVNECGPNVLLRNSGCPDCEIALRADYFAMIADCADVMLVKDGASAAMAFTQDGGVAVVMPMRI